jgi:hypothetical protein
VQGAPSRHYPTPLYSSRLPHTSTRRAHNRSFSPPRGSHQFGKQGIAGVCQSFIRPYLPSPYRSSYHTVHTIDPACSIVSPCLHSQSALWGPRRPLGPPLHPPSIHTSNTLAVLRRDPTCRLKHKLRVHRVRRRRSMVIARGSATMSSARRSVEAALRLCTRGTAV